MNAPLDTIGSIDTARSEASRARVLTILERLKALLRRRRATEYGARVGVGHEGHVRRPNGYHRSRRT